MQLISITAIIISSVSAVVAIVAGWFSLKARAKIEKPSPAADEGPALEAEKLRLEVEKLRKDLRPDKLKIFTTVAAMVSILGIIGTLSLGLRQLHQAQVVRIDERFESVVTRLSSSQPSERLAGLSGLEQFLRGTNSEYQGNALHYLVNAAVIEQDPTVRGAIVDVFETAPKFHLSAQLLNAALLTARDRNRAIYRRLAMQFTEEERAGKTPRHDPSYSEVPFGSPPEKQLRSLEASASAIAALVRAGGKVEDLSGIYCADCVFSTVDSPSNLSGVKFDNSILRDAMFTNAELKSASFNDTDLSEAYFISSDLQFAKITASPPSVPWSFLAVESSGNLSSAEGANFSCSDLSHADFTGSAIFGLINQNPEGIGAVHDEFRFGKLGPHRLPRDPDFDWLSGVQGTSDFRWGT